MQQQSVTWCNTKYQERLTLAHSHSKVVHRQTRGSQPWLRRLGPTRSAAHPTRLFAAPDHKNSSWSPRLLESLHAARTAGYPIFAHTNAYEDCFDLPSSHVKMRSGSKSEAQKSNRILVRTLVPGTRTWYEYLSGIIIDDQ